MQKQQFGMLIMAILFLISGCSSISIPEDENQETTTTTTPLPATTPAKLIGQVDMAQKKWKALEITNYHIVIKFHENFANGIETQRDVTVKNGHMIDSFCIADKCPAFVLTDVYTIDDLFSVARGSTLASMKMFDDYNDCVKVLEFDDIYGYPRSMRIDCPLAVDEEHSFKVISFEELK